MPSVKLQILTHLSGIWRRRWYFLATAWFVCLVGWIAVALLPDTYEAEAKVYVDTDSLMGPLLKGLTVTPNTDQQVSVMLRTFTARPNLEKVVDATNPKAQSLSPIQMEQAVTQLDQGIDVKSLGSKNLFSIAYSAHDPKTAEAVTQALVSTLVDSSIGDKRRDMEDAQSFLDNKIAEYEKSLREAEKRAAQFKQENIEFLSHQSTDSRLDAARVAVDQAQQELDLARTKRDSIRAELGGTPATVDAASSVIVINNGNAGSDSARASVLARLRAKKEQLAELRARFTDSYPDVIATQKAVDQLQSELKSTPQEEAADEGGGRSQAQNPIYEQLRLRLADEETNVALQTRRLQDAMTEQSRAKDTADKATDVQAKAADLDRDYDILKKNYQELLERRESARLTQAQDERQQDVALRVIEPPERATSPVSPNRPLLNSMVLIFGLAAGAGFCVFLTIAGGTFSVSEQLVEMFDLPVIGVVTAVRQSLDAGKFRMSAIGLGAAVAALLVCYLGVMLTVKTSINAAFSSQI